MREFTVFDIQEHLEAVFKNGYYLENRRKPETNPGYRRIQEIRKILERYFMVIQLCGSRPFRGKLYQFSQKFPSVLTKEMREQASKRNNNKIREDKLDHVMHVYNEEVANLIQIKKKFK